MFTAFAAVLILLALGFLYVSHRMAWEQDAEPLTIFIILEILTALNGVLEATVVQSSASSSAGAKAGDAVGVWICLLGVGWFVLSALLLKNRRRPKGAEWLPYAGLCLLGAAFIAGGIFQFVRVA